jgi:hypothetical protein
MRKRIWLTAVAMALSAPGICVAQQQSSQSGQTSQTSQTAQSQSSSDKQTATQTKPAAQTAQQTIATPTVSLAEAARKARAAEKNAPKATTVFTNDNIPTSTTGVSVVGQESAAPGEAASSETQASAAGANDEAAWRERFAAARHKIEQDQEELTVMQREMGELNVQYYSNPTTGLMQSVDRTDITKKQDAIDAKQKQLAADKQALSNLEDELRKAGGDPGWARE